MNIREVAAFADSLAAAIDTTKRNGATPQELATAIRSVGQDEAQATQFNDLGLLFLAQVVFAEAMGGNGKKKFGSYHSIMMIAASEALDVKLSKDAEELLVTLSENYGGYTMKTLRENTGFNNDTVSNLIAEIKRVYGEAVIVEVNNKYCLNLKYFQLPE